LGSSNSHTPLYETLVVMIAIGGYPFFFCTK